MQMLQVFCMLYLPAHKKEFGNLTNAHKPFPQPDHSINAADVPRHREHLGGHQHFSPIYQGKEPQDFGRITPFS